jgi:hypothetical protein
MTQPSGSIPSPHLTADELELWAAGLLSSERTMHLADCAECLTVGERERKLFRELAQLARFAPSPEFLERVLAKLEIPTTSARQGR